MRNISGVTVGGPPADYLKIREMQNISNRCILQHIVAGQYMTENPFEFHVNIRSYRVQEKLEMGDPLVGRIFSSSTGNIQDFSDPAASWRELIFGF